MTAKDYLSQVQRLEYKIKRMKMRAEEYEQMSYSLSSPRMDGMPSSGTRSTDAPYVKWVIKKCELDTEIKALEEKLVNVKAEVLLAIESLDNEDYKDVLILRYINGLSFQQIARKFYVVDRTVFRWHREALEKIIVPQKVVS